MPGYLYRPPLDSTAPWRAGFLGFVPRDAGLVQPVVEPLMPQSAPAPLRAARLATTIVQSAPRDAGTLPTSVYLPDLARGPRLAANAAYQVELFATPMDAGTAPTSVYLPDRASAPRLPLANYAIANFGPQDAGAAPIFPECPDFAAGPRRTANQAYLALVAPPPLDAGLTPVWPEYQDIAPGSRRTANEAYTITTAAPLDTVADTYIPGPDLPDLARGAMRGPATSYVSLVSPTPREPLAVWPAYDTFTDTAGTDLPLHAPDSGGMWLLHPSYSTGDMVITDANRLRSNSTVNGLYYHTALLTSADYDVAGEVRCFTNSANKTIGVVGRISPTANTLYFADYRGATGFRLFRIVSGTGLQLGSTYTRVLNAGETARLTLRMLGTAISLLVDGTVQVGPITDSSITAAGFAGLYANSGAGGADTNSTGAHLDNWNAQYSDPPIAGLLPDRTFRPSPRGYAQFTSTPLDVVVANPNVFPILPDIARAPRLPLASYAIFDVGPVDAGLAQPVVEPVTPDRAPAAQRTARLAYAITQPAPGDSGVVAVAPALLPSMPDRVPPRLAQTYYSLVVAAPRDAGLLPIPLAVTDLARVAAPRPAGFTLLIGTPRDAGTLPASVYLPDRASGQTNRAALDLLVLAPRDAGIVLVSASVAPAMPDRIVPRPTQAPYSLIVAAPRDAGTLPPRDLWPDRASSARRAGTAAYHAELITTPRDAGLLQPIIPAVLPWRAPGPLWAAQSSYIALATPPPPTSNDLTSFPDPFGAVRIASADPFSSADPFGAAFVVSTDFAGADPQKARLL